MDIELTDKDILDSVPEMLEGSTLVDVDVEEGGAAADEDTGEAPRRDRRSRCGDSIALSLLLTTTILYKVKNHFQASEESMPLRSQRDKDYHRNAESKRINFWCAPDLRGPQKRNFRSG